MTCIAGLEHDGVCYIGGDSMGSNGHTGLPYDRPKVFKRADIIFGVCGSFRLMQQLEFNYTPPRRHIGQELDEYIYVDFLKSLEEFLKISECLLVKEGIPKLFRADFLFGYQGRLYKLQSDLSILRTKCGFNATGSGEDYALASLYSSDGLKIPPEERIKRAIECANNFAVSVNDDVTIISTLEPQIGATE